MAKYVVEMFGLSPDITELRKVEIELGDEPRLADIVAALRQRVPALEGVVIRPGEDRLTDRYVFNINGQFYFDGREPKLQKGDRIVLLTLATVG
jgi:molybdopterin converting factor small subunit